MGLAVWDGVIRGDRVSNALVSSLDLLPTIVSLSGKQLKPDRSYDGMDISPLLFGKTDKAHETLFHPASSTEITAMRYRNYKAHFRTYGQQPCRLPNGTHLPVGDSMVHNPPLVFDLDQDPAESQPIDPGPQIMDEIMRAFQAFWQDVNSTLKSVTSFDEDPSFRPCSNTSSVCCRLIS